MSKLPTIDELKSQISYKEYLTTKEWKDISDECRKLHNNKCNRCDNTKNLQAHHKHYDNIGNENQEDLECLCIECHSKEHDRDLRSGNSKNGWFRMYDEMLDVFGVCRSNKENQMLIYLIRQTNKNLTLFMPTIELSKKFEVSKVKATDFINRLKKFEFIFGARGAFFVNPEMYLPKNIKNEEAKELQDNWNKIKEK